MKKTFTAQLVKSSEHDGLFVLSDETPDRDGDVISASGWDLSHFSKNPVALWSHDTDRPIGFWKNVRVEGKRLLGELKLAGTQLAKFAKQLISDDALRAVSVGFNIKDYDPIPGGGLHIKAAELLEVSLVAVGANPSALLISKSFKLSQADKVLAFGSAVESDPQSQSKPSGVRRMTTLADKILAQAAEVENLKATVADSQKKLSEISEAYDPSDENCDISETAVQELSDKVNETIGAVEKAEKRLAAMKSMEAAMAARAQAVKAPGIIKAKSTELEPGDIFIKVGMASCYSRHHNIPVDAALKRLYPGNDAVKAVAGHYYAKTAVPAADTMTAGWAAELVSEQIRGFLGLLTENSVAASVASRTMTMTFQRGDGAITVPRINQLPLTGNTEPAWVGEGGVIPLGRFSFGSATLTPSKLAFIVPMTMELAERSLPDAESVFRSAMLEQYSLVLDEAFLSNVAAIPGVRPAGILNGRTPVAADTAGGYESVIADLQNLHNELTDARLGQAPVVLLNTKDLRKARSLLNPLGQQPFAGTGGLDGYTVISGLTVPQGTVVMVEPRAWITAFGGPEFRISQEATLTMANADGTAPTQASGDAGGIGTAGQVPVGGGIAVGQGANTHNAGYATQSLFQTYSQAIRGIWPSSWTEGRPGSVAYMTGINW